jgi:NAD(P)-dependent dehydrogenase (short-subunit alcohol dehydrogenase family)
MSTIIVTGADRGLGVALCETWARRGDTVIAACLKDAPALLDQMGVEVVTEVDVTTKEGVGRLAKHVGLRTIDVLMNNAGVVIDRPLGSFDYKALQKEFDVNALGPLRVVEALLPNLASGSKIGIVTTRVASLSENGAGGLYGYRMSKAAANMAGINLAHELKPKGISVICLHPGSVRTQMAASLMSNAVMGSLVTPEESARGLIQRLEELTLETTGTFRHANGQSLPW